MQDRSLPQQFRDECTQLALTLLPSTWYAARRSAGIERAEFGLGAANRRLNALPILVWPNTQRWRLDRFQEHQTIPARLRAVLCPGPSGPSRPVIAQQ